MTGAGSRARYRRFTTTRWSLILAAADPRSSSAHEALSSLCEIYWMAVYAFVRRTGASVEDARDLTQAFFAVVIEKGYFKDAQRERGRFRTFLLTAVAHFLSNRRKADRALKRGGGHIVLSLDVDDGERRYQLDPADTMTPERLFDRRWALAVLDHAMARLSAQYATPDRRKVFTTLKPFLDGHEPESHSAAATSLSLTEGSFRVKLHRFRKQFAASLRDVVQETVERPEDVEDELRYLLKAVGR